MPTVYGPEYAGKEGTGLSRERKGVSVCMLRSTRPRIRGSGEGTVMVSGNFWGLMYIQYATRKDCTGRKDSCARKRACYRGDLVTLSSVAIQVSEFL